MKTMYNIINIAKLITILSFVLGTCLLLSFLLFPQEDSIAFAGLYYVGYVSLINAVLFLVLIITAFVYWDYRIKVFKTCGLLLLNIPIAIGYFFIVITY
jgi:hypothetical protein